MTVRRLLSLVSVGLATTVTVASAQPTPPPAPAPAPGAGAPAPAAEAPAEPPAPVEEPPKDIEGRDENPDAPRSPGGDAEVKVVAPVKQRTSGYPIEEAYRPITLPQNMSEVVFDPHVQVAGCNSLQSDSGACGTTALRARYGITRQVQLGLTYVLGAMYSARDVDPGLAKKYGVHAGKAVGLDVTVLLENWVGVRVGVPVYIDPVAFGLTLGAPMRFRLHDKVTIGGLDDLLEIKLQRFVPSFYQEQQNASRAFQDSIMTAESRGALRFSAYGIYQHETKLALIARFGIHMENFGDAGAPVSFLRAGVQYTPRKFVDVGFSIGLDNLARAGSFTPAGLVAFRI